jgi:DNA repair protein RadA/Sms
MMPKKQKQLFKCQTCGFESAKWLGKCPDCDSWDSFQEVVLNTSDNATHQRGLGTSGKTKLESQQLKTVLAESLTNKTTHYPFASDLLNGFWNKGLTAGSFTLLAGEPGLGKSTLALQLLRSLAVSQDQALYISAEESLTELAKRAHRLGISEDLQLIHSNNFGEIKKYLIEHRPQVVILDSVQTIYIPEIPSAPGSITQVSTIASEFLELTKTLNIAVIMIGHVNKEGQVAGPKTLEHLVDSVLMIERTELSSIRSLSFNKHRYGSTDQQLLMRMEESGLQILTDPSLAFLENMETDVGVCYGLALEKQLPMVTEIQTLISEPKQQQGFGRREAIGMPTSKLHTILAICEKYLNLDLGFRDVYLKLSGLPKKFTDDSLELPILLAILSSYYRKPVDQLLKLKGSKHLFSGRVTLNGSLRKATSNELRESTAKKLKFGYNQGIKMGKVENISAS